MKQSMALCIVLAALCGDMLLAQVPTATPRLATADTGPVFEVATIKPSRPEERLAMLVKGHQFITTASSLYDLIAFAYGLHARQVTNVPAWLETERYDVTAQSGSEEQPKGERLRVMVQKLLADRFKLSFHREKKELPAFTITVGKAGIKIAQSSDPNGTPGVGFSGPGAMIVKSATISDFAGFMQRYVMDRPVVDQTHLAGKYDFTLNWTANETQFEGRAFEPPNQTGDAADLFTEIQEQLGLKLESAKVPVEVLIIDRIEKPSDN
jgi:uncharacterized protein (TIGR03435 family)